MRSKKERSFALSFSSQEKPMLRGEVHACPHGLAFEVEDTRPPPSALKSQTQKYPIARDPSWLTGGFDSWPRNSYMLWAWSNVCVCVCIPQPIFQASSSGGRETFLKYLWRASGGGSQPAGLARAHLQHPGSPTPQRGASSALLNPAASLSLALICCLFEHDSNAFT